MLQLLTQGALSRQIQLSLMSQSPTLLADRIPKPKEGHKLLIPIMAPTIWLKEITMVKLLTKPNKDQGQDP